MVLYDVLHSKKLNNVQSNLAKVALVLLWRKNALALIHFAKQMIYTSCVYIFYKLAQISYLGRILSLFVFSNYIRDI